MRAKLMTMAVAGLTGLLLLGVMAGWPRAEKVPMSEAQMKKMATHIVTGKVTAIYTKKVKQGSYEVTKHLAELQVTAVEKGEGISKEAPLYVRYWTQRFTGWGSPPPGTNGHHPLPKEGGTHRVYLARKAYDGFHPKAKNDDGGYNVLGANGWTAWKPEAAAKKQ